MIFAFNHLHFDLFLEKIFSYYLPDRKPILVNKILNFFKKKATPRKVKQHSLLGEFYDLKVLYDQVNNQYFEGKLKLDIRWVGNKYSMPKRRVMFGSYNEDLKIINIHRRLDQSHIPLYFITFIIYHEMLHYVHPPIRQKRQKAQIHHPTFQEQEKLFAEYPLVEAYRKKMKTKWFRR